MKDTRTDDPAPPLQILSDRSLLIKQLPQATRHWERAPLSILRLPWIESDFAGAEIDLSPFERQDLTIDPPTRDVRESCDGPHRLRQPRQHRQKLVTLEEADADVVLVEESDVSYLEELACLDREIEHPLDRSQLTVDLTRDHRHGPALLWAQGEGCRPWP